MKLSDKKNVQQIVAALAEFGLKEVVICPGSRNAPFIITFHRYGAFHCTSIRDERSAAFFALGKIIESGRPVAIVCTSGSAALNFAPAIAEAYYQRLPLIVITADRPKAWTGQGDGQTINQTNIYKNYIRAFFELDGDAADEESLWYHSRCISEGYAIATSKDPGPVHFNVPLKEPLYGEGEPEKNLQKLFSNTDAQTFLPETVIKDFQKIFSKTAKVMILVGQSISDESFSKAIKKMAVYENTIVLTESTSNIHDKDFIENIDRCITTLRPEETENCMPDLLITVGGAIVSKRIKALLRKYKPKRHWNIDPHSAFMDTYQSLTNPVFAKPEVFFDQLNVDLKNIIPGYKKNWIRRKKQMEKFHLLFMKDVEYCDYAAFSKIYQTIPKGLQVHLSNSSPVRYAQLFDNRKIASSWCNRGTSGIDGCTSTAMGAASASPEKDFLLITGDVAFFYDINALWNEADVKNLKIIVINNGGGGIFRIISGSGAAPEMDEFFETSQQRDLRKIAASYKWAYLAANNKATLEKALDQFFLRMAGRIILEIKTPAKKNPEVLQQYWDYLKKNDK